MRTRSSAALSLFLALIFTAASAEQGLPAGTPASVGMDAATLNKAVDLYRDAVKRDDIRGAVLYVARRGRVVLHEAVGWRHHAYRLPMEKDTLFRMASNTKPVVAAAVMLLAEEGKLALSDPASKHLKAFANEKSGRITIEQLLTHSSGLRIGPILLPFAEGEARTLQNAVAKFGAQGPTAAAGSYSYNNAGYNTLGAIIEVVSGQPLETFLKTRFYDPLQMADSGNHEDPAKLHRMATVYRGQRAASGVVTFTQAFTPGDAPDFPVIRASGGMISTAHDYARFLEMYRLGGTIDGRRILRPETTRAAVQPRVKINDSSSYGAGWMVRADGTYSHSGSDGTMAWVDPARELIAMVLTQSPGGNNPTAQFRALVEQSVSVPKHTPADTAFMQGMIGHHAQAIEMVDLLKTRTASPDMKLMGLRIEVSQNDEIKLMQTWLRDREEKVPDEHAHHMQGARLMPGMLSSDQMVRLAAVKSAEFDRLFLEFMIQHHEGALTMVKELMASPGAAQESNLFAFVSDVEADQSAEIIRMRRMRGAMGK